MFCNKCGKTLSPEATACPNCGQPVGDSRFEGSGIPRPRIASARKGRARGVLAITPKRPTPPRRTRAGPSTPHQHRPALSSEEGRQTTALRTPSRARGAPEGEPETAEGARRSRAGAPKPRRRARSARRKGPLGFEIRPMEPSEDGTAEVQRSSSRRPEKEPRPAQGGRREPQEARRRRASAAARRSTNTLGGLRRIRRAAASRASGRCARACSWGRCSVRRRALHRGQDGTRARFPASLHAVHRGFSQLSSTPPTVPHEIIKLWRATRPGAPRPLAGGRKPADHAASARKALENDQLFVDTPCPSRIRQERTATDPSRDQRRQYDVGR